MFCTRLHVFIFPRRWLLAVTVSPVSEKVSSSLDASQSASVRNSCSIQNTSVDSSSAMKCATIRKHLSKFNDKITRSGDGVTFLVAGVECACAMTHSFRVFLLLF